MFIATQTEVASLPEEEIPIDVFPGVDIKGIGLIELASLFALTVGAEFDSSLDAFPIVAGERSEQGPWVNQLPNELVRRLANLPEDELVPLAVAWARSEQFEGLDWHGKEVEGKLTDIVRLARRAHREAKPIHLWTCL